MWTCHLNCCISVNWHRCKSKNHCQTEQCHCRTQCNKRHNNNESHVLRAGCMLCSVDSIQLVFWIEIASIRHTVLRRLRSFWWLQRHKKIYIRIEMACHKPFPIARSHRHQTLTGAWGNTVKFKLWCRFGCTLSNCNTEHRAIAMARYRHSDSDID